jgi:putative membrane protein
VYQLDYHPSRRWALLPLLIAAGLVATFVGVWLYTGDIAAPANTATTPWFWWFPFGWFIFIPIFFLIFYAVRWYFWGGWWWGRGWYYGGYDPALETLKQRYARGEITKEQYDRMRKDLEQSEQGSAN